MVPHRILERCCQKQMSLINFVQGWIRAVRGRKNDRKFTLAHRNLGCRISWHFRLHPPSVCRCFQIQTVIHLISDRALGRAAAQAPLRAVTPPKLRRRSDSVVTHPFFRAAARGAKRHAVKPGGGSGRARAGPAAVKLPRQLGRISRTAGVGRMCCRGAIWTAPAAGARRWGTQCRK